MQYFKDRTESFDDYYPCIQQKENECNLLHVYNWIQFFVSMYNNTIKQQEIMSLKLINGGNIP
jgi:putative transposase